MAKGRVNTGGGGNGKSEIIVTALTGSTVTCSNGQNIKTATEKNGVWTFTGCDIGTWIVNASLNGESEEVTVVILESGQLMRYEVTITYGLRASDFDWASFGTLGEDFEIVDDDDVDIPQSEWATTQNWKARLLTSNSLVPLKSGKIDVFLVGGGGAGGGTSNSTYWCYASGAGGGYTETEKSVNVDSGVSYNIIIGAGGIGANGANGGNGGNTTAFGIVAAGGYGGKLENRQGGSSSGANGGSGGGSGLNEGGENGGNGDSESAGGKGQIATPGPNGETGITAEFGDENGRAYSGGGQGGLYTGTQVSSNGGGGVGGKNSNGGNGDPNTGGGGGGSSSEAGTKKGGSGGCGIVVIRNERRAA